MNISINGIKLNASDVTITRDEIMPDDHAMSLEEPHWRDGYEWEVEFVVPYKPIARAEFSQEAMNNLIRPLPTKSKFSYKFKDTYKTFVITRRDYKRNRVHLRAV